MRQPAPTHGTLPRADEEFDIDAEGRVVIEIVVSNYDDLFNILDRAPFRRRDLSADLKQFLNEYALWVPLGMKVRMDFHLTLEAPHPEREAEVVKGIRAYFAYLVRLASRERRRRWRRLAGFVGLSFLCMAATLWLTPLLGSEDVLSTFILNGLTVGGWVFLWEALTVGLIRRLDEWDSEGRHQRFADAPIQFSFGDLETSRE